jgi:radical SAM enzyme (TIGR01210 family)
MNLPDFSINNEWVWSKRGDKIAVSPFEPYAVLVEQERTASGSIEDVGTIFLTNSECPYRCLMCDLWKNTLEGKTSLGAIPRQIGYALERLPSVRHIKLYNSGNFFDTKAIPPKDYPAIADLLKGFETVLVENHPRLMGRRVLEFQKKLKGQLQVAMGLETAHPQVLSMLNKQMTLKDFRRAAVFLQNHDISSRVFILLSPPFLDETEGIEWAKKSIDFAFDCEVECCVVIPTRAGNGAMELLAQDGFFKVPKLKSLEEVLDYGVALKRGRVFADLWDLNYFSNCEKCYEQRRSRLVKTNLTQSVADEVRCSCV